MMARPRRAMFPILACILAAGPVRSQEGEPGICSALQDQKPGIYVSYPSRELARAGAGLMRYEPDIRIFYLGRNPDYADARRPDHVWHVRTQTSADGAAPAQAVLAYRPPVETRCRRRAKAGPLPALDEDQRFVTIPEYADHHAPSDGRWGYRRMSLLRSHFHLSLDDGDDGRACTPTDDRTAYRDQWDLYGFEDVSRSDNQIVTALAVVPGARASVPQSAGLSSEFRYLETAGRACFEISAPVPTRLFSSTFLFGPSQLALARDAADDWRPRETTVIVQRIQNRKVKEISRYSIAWDRRGRP